MNELLDTTLDEMLDHPDTDHGFDHGLWGSTESYELQVLLLLELRFFPHARNELMQNYFMFFRPKFPDLGARPVSALRRVSAHDLAAHFRAFREDLIGQPKVPTIPPVASESS